MTDHSPPRSSASLLRRIIVGVIIASFGLAAVLGIVVLLGFEMGDTAGRVLATTAVIGCFSVAVLCCASLVGRRAQLIGVVGVVVSILSAALVVWSVWDNGLYDRWDVVMRLIWTGVAVSAAFSLACLLLLLSDRRRSAVRVGLWVTLGLIALLLALTLYLVWSREIPWDDFARLYGIVAILTALGAVVVPVMSLLMPDAHSAVGRALAERLTAEAQRRGISVEELVAPVLAAEPAPEPPAS